MGGLRVANVTKQAVATVVVIALLAGCFGSDDSDDGAGGEGSASPAVTLPTLGPTARALLFPTPPPNSPERILETIRASGLTGEYVETETLSFIEQVVDDPGQAVDTLVTGITALMIIVFDDEIPFEHKVEVLGETLVPFWSCVRPVVGGPLFDPVDFDLSRINMPECEREVMQTFLLGAAGHLAGRLTSRADNLADLRFTPADAERFVSTTGDLYGWTSSIYEQGIDPNLPLIAQRDEFPVLRNYERFAHPSLFEARLTVPEDFDWELFQTRTQPFRTPSFRFPTTLALPDQSD